MRVQYFWQKRAAPDKPSADDRNTVWVPVMQRAAGPTRGASFLPRIGEEVLVGTQVLELHVGANVIKWPLASHVDIRAPARANHATTPFETGFQGVWV